MPLHVLTSLILQQNCSFLKHYFVCNMSHSVQGRLGIVPVIILNHILYLKGIIFREIECDDEFSLTYRFLNIVKERGLSFCDEIVF